MIWCKSGDDGCCVDTDWGCLRWRVLVATVEWLCRHSIFNLARVAYRDKVRARFGKALYTKAEKGMAKQSHDDHDYRCDLIAIVPSSRPSSVRTRNCSSTLGVQFSRTTEHRTCLSCLDKAFKHFLSTCASCSAIPIESNHKYTSPSFPQSMNLS